MWLVLVVFLAGLLALIPGLPERRVRLLSIPIVLVLVAYEAVSSHLLL